MHHVKVKFLTKSFRGKTLAKRIDVAEMGPWYLSGGKLEHDHLSHGHAVMQQVKAKVDVFEL